MSKYFPPNLRSWKSDLEPVAYHDWGDDYDTVYTYSPCKGVVYKIWHEEEEYGNDTHGWQANIEYSDGLIDVTYKEMRAEDALSKLRKKLEDLDSEGRFPWEPKTKKELDAEKRLKTLEKKLEEYEEKTDVRIARTSEFIGCSVCGSKLSRILLKNTYCPLCRNDLRSATVQDTIKRYKEKISDIKRTYHL